MVLPSQLIAVFPIIQDNLCLEDIDSVLSNGQWGLFLEVSNGCSSVFRVGELEGRRIIKHRLGMCMLFVGVEMNPLGETFETNEA